MKKGTFKLRFRLDLSISFAGLLALLAMIFGKGG